MWDHHEVSPNRARSRKPNLMEKLQEKSKLQKSKNSPQEEDVVYLLPGFGNKNAAKHTRLIEFGWMHNQKQVRSRNGGGTRRLIVPKNAGYEHLFKLGKDLFFPNGLSTKGPETDFIFNIRDFGGSEMPRGATVGALYEPLKHGMLRLYLCSLDRGQSEPEFQIKCESESESCNSEDVSSPGKQLGNFKRCDGGPCSASDFNCSYSNSAHEVLGYSQESYHLVVEASPSFKPRRHTPLDSNSSDSAHEVFGDFQESYPPVFEAPSFTAAHPQTPKRARWEPHQSSAPRTLGPHRTNTVHNTIDQFEDSTQESQQNSSLRTLRLRRPNIAHDMIKQFEDPDILDVSLSVSFVDESGIDTLGLASVSVSFAEESGIDTPSLAQEAYSSFWEAFLQTDAAGGGTLERVPALRPDYGKAEWEAVGRVLLKGFQDHGYFPTQLSRAFAVCLVLGEEELTPDMLIESFLRFTSPAERLILSSALEGREYSMDSLLDILHRMRVCTLPEGGTIADVILRMAHTRLVQEPMYALLRMASTARTGLRQLLPTASAVSALYPTHTQPRALLHEHSPAQHEFNSCTL